MKINLTTALAFASSLAFLSCSQDMGVENDIAEVDGISKAKVSTRGFKATDDYIDASSRSTINPTTSPISFAWAGGDKIAVYSGGDATGMTNFDLSSLAANNKEAIFKANGFNLNGGAEYHAFSPYDASSTDKTQVAVSYDGIRQESNGGYSHLGKYDYQWATAIAEGNTDAANIDFDFQHLGAICRFRINDLPQGVAFSRMTISCEGIITKGTVNLTQPIPAIVAASGNNSTQTIALGSVSGFSATGGTLTVYTMMAPADLSGKTMTIKLYEAGKSESYYIYNVSGKAMVAGSAYGYTVSDKYVDLGVIDANGKAIMWAKYNAGAYSYAGAVDASNNVWKNTWGTAEAWRLPSEADFVALTSQTYSEWVTQYNGENVSGRVFYKVKKEEDKGKFDDPDDDYYPSDDIHIFLPATNSTGSGAYWTSDADDKNSGNSFYFAFYKKVGDVYSYPSVSATESFSVRPVFTRE